MQRDFVSLKNMKPDYSKTFSYKPGRTLEELENERRKIAMQKTPQERLNTLFALIEISMEMRKARAQMKKQLH